MRMCLCLLILCVVSCGGPKIQESPKTHITILSTIAMIDDMVKEIGQEHLEHITLIKGELDPHAYELVKGDDEKFLAADVIFCNGLGLEHGYTLRHNLENNPKVVALGDLIYQKEPSCIIQIEGKIDPHIWMDVSLWEKTIDPIVERLALIDPEHAEIYKKNGEALKERFQQKDVSILQRVQKIPEEKRYLVSSHNAFHYFVRRYLAELEEKEGDAWMKRAAAPEGLAPEAELSIRDIQRVLNHIQKYNIHVLFSESNVNKDALKKIIAVAKEKGISLFLGEHALYADSMGREGSYLNMIEHNVSIIEKEMPK